MPFWRLYYHIIWSTKNRDPLITPEIENDLHGYIIGKADAKGVIVHAIGGIDNHIHLVASIPPRLSIADIIGHLKGSSSFHINHTAPDYDLTFDWQRGYGIFSLGQKQLSIAVSYVHNQKQHHTEGTTILQLEKEGEKDDSPEK